MTYEHGVHRHMRATFSGFGVLAFAMVLMMLLTVAPVAAAGTPTGGHVPDGAGGSSAPFDRSGGVAALRLVEVASCKEAGGPTGTGHVTVTFSPNGRVSAAVVDSPPFKGTSVGGCIASKFRSPHVPPFAGSPVTIGQTFTLT